MSEEQAATNAAQEPIAQGNGPESQVTESAPVATNASEAPKKDSFTERVDELTRNWREEQRTRAQIERDRDHWRDLALKPQQQQQISPADDKPKTLADFEYDEAKFQAYIFDQAQKKSVEAAKRELQEAGEREAAIKRRTSFISRESAFAKTVEDYDSVTRNPSLPITKDMVEAIEDSEDGPALLYHLGKNPDITAKIAQLPPKAAARELGRIEERLSAEREKAKADKVSKAPAPPPKIEGANPSTNVKPDDSSSDELSDEEWTRRRNKQLAKRG